tara:strand:+ start:3358 stop:4014 length:657 start_codon:yes stop_codon:yes gene_type:complete
MLFLRFKYFGKRKETKIARKYFDLIIDGFPRSANSYTTRLFKQLEPRYHIGHHLHSVSHIIYGLKKSIPSIVLIRNPKDAIISLAALDIIECYSGETKKFLRENSLKWIIKKYIRFYKPLTNHVDKFLLVDFEVIINCPIRIIKAFNNKFNLNFETDPEILKYFNNLIIRRAKSHLKPSYNRNQIKLELLNEINSHDLTEYLNEANKIYNELLKINVK